MLNAANGNFLFSFNRLRFFIGLILGAIFFLFLAAKDRVFVGSFVCLMCVLLSFLNIRIGSNKKAVLAFVWFFCAILSITQMSQMIVGCSIISVFQHDWKNFISAVLLPMTLPLLLMTITLRFRLSFFVGASPFLLLSFINYFVRIFRGSELNPVDLISVRTAMQVVGNYQFNFGNLQLYGIFLFVLIFWSSFCFQTVSFRKKNLVRIVFFLLTVLCLFFSVGRLSFVKIYNWCDEGSRFNSFLLNFSAQLKSALNQKPDGYSYEIVREIESRYRNSDYFEGQENEYPSIIAIMDESYADISTLNPKLDRHQFYKNLNENVIRGLALSSAFGGGTANSEYEFLTGNSMAFVEQGSSMYLLYIKDSTYSMARYLKKIGYDTYATHPFNKQGWSRFSVWPYLGFDHISFEEDYPQKKKIRNFISDQEMFEYIVNIFESKGDKPMFLFGVTMQNHGSYNADVCDKDLCLPEEDLSGFPDAELYRGLIRESDRALTYLISYFEHIHEKVVIVFFGDHYPGLNMEFYKTIYGKSFNTLQEKQKLYTVPFFIWANYSIEKKDIELSSLNYLSNYVYDVAGIPLPPFNRFLLEAQKDIPSMNSLGYYSKKQNNFVEYKSAQDKERKILQEYRMLYYNSLHDKKNRSKFFFGEW